MKKFEYKEFQLLGSKLTAELNELGEQGWEMVSMISSEEIPPRDPYSEQMDALLYFVGKKEK